VGDAVLVGVAEVGRNVEAGEGGVNVATGCPLSEASEVISSSAPSEAKTMTRMIPVRRDMRAILARQTQMTRRVK
jgi:hypothetical protein